MSRNPTSATKPATTSRITPTGFRDEAIALVGTAIAQRRAIIAKGQSWPLGLDHRQVIAQYQIYKDSWTVRGIARFYYNHGKAILDMIPWTNGPAVIRCKEIIEQSTQMIRNGF